MTERNGKSIERLPQGFSFGGVRCGIKQDVEALDLSLIRSDDDVVAAGVYTRNLIVAAPVEWDRRITPSRSVRGVLVNSGNANACTGERGMADTVRMAEGTAAAMGVRADQVLVMSTGIIGEFLPLEKIEAGIPRVVECSAGDCESLVAAARGMMTTDRREKLAGRVVSVGSQSASVVGIAKGAGMIGPRMATMLAVIMTDAALSLESAQRILAAVADRSFNCISVEGHTSTNDTVLLLSSGKVATAGDGDEALVADAIEQVAIELAKQIPSDGEGASHLITIAVEGASDFGAARKVARTVADSPLVKTAVTGADPNWGRIVSAAGYAGVPFDPAKLTLRLNGVELFAGGVPVRFDAPTLSRIMRDSFETRIELDLHAGDSACTFWTSDLTHEYITINAEYHT